MGETWNEEIQHITFELFQNNMFWPQMLMHLIFPSGKKRKNGKNKLTNAMEL